MAVETLCGVVLNATAFNEARTDWLVRAAPPNVARVIIAMTPDLEIIIFFKLWDTFCVLLVLFGFTTRLYHLG